MDVRVGLWRKLSAKELMLLNCGVGEDSWESLGLQGDPTSQSILKGISPRCSLEGLMLKLKLQYCGHLMWRADSLEKTLMLGKTEDKRRRGRQRMRWLDGITDSWTWVWVDSGSWWWTGRPGMLRFIGLQRIGHNWATELNWRHFGCHTEVEGAGSYQRPGMLQISYTAQDSPHSKELANPKCQ